MKYLLTLAALAATFTGLAQAPSEAILGFATSEISSHVDLPAFQVATFHFVLNIALAAIFLPLAKTVSWAAQRWIPITEEERTFGAKYLLKEKVTPKRWLGVALVFLGVLLVVATG